MLLKFLPSIYLGWALGTNDAANVFGPPVISGTVRYREAIIIAAVLVIIGSVAEGWKCMPTVGGITRLESLTAAIACLAAAVIVNLMSFLKLPVSTSQAIIGGIIGVGLLRQTPISYAKLIKILICWLSTPIGAALIALLFYKLLAFLWQSRVKNIRVFNITIKVACILIGSYGAYSLGANNVANVAGALVGAGLISPFRAALWGGISIALGILTYSKNVMITVGKKITPLDPFSSLVAILASAVTLHIFTQLRVPISSSQSIVGAVCGIGLIKGVRSVSKLTLILVFIGWIATFLGSAALAYGLGWIFR